MGKGIRGILIKAHYYNCILNGTFEDESGNRYYFRNLKAITPDSQFKERKFFFSEDENSENICFSVTVKKDKLNHQLTGEDFINRDDSFIYLED